MIHRVKTTVVVAIFLVFIVATAGFGADSPSSKPEKISKDDADFVKAAASGGMVEVQLGKTAQEKASSSQVKEFGRRMQTDHSKANDELKKIAAKKTSSRRPSSKANTNRPLISFQS